MGKKKDTLGKKGETNTDAAEDYKAEDNEKNKNKSAPNKTTGKKPTVKDPSQNEVKKKNFITRNKIIKRDKMKKETMTIRKPPKETVAVAKENIAETHSGLLRVFSHGVRQNVIQSQIFLSIFGHTK